MKKITRILLLTIFSIFNFQFSIVSQTVYEHTSSAGIYLFLDEMANDKIILLNTAVKPYSRIVIAEKLKEIYSKKDKLNKRQQADLKFYLREYYIELQTDSIPPDLQPGPLKPFRHKQGHTISLLPPIYAFTSKPFSLNFRPVGGGTGYANSKGIIYNSYFGGNLFLYGLKNLGIYASYRDAHQANEVLAQPTYLTQSLGGNYKINEGDRPGGDYSEMRGGITYTYKWFNLGLVKDHVQWGNNYNGSVILSGRTPSFPMIKLKVKPVKWFELNYFHGWLVSEVIDSTRSYSSGGGIPREIYRDKYIAANFITIGPIKGVALTMGNSIVYSDVDVQPAFLIPFLFYKSVDHTLSNNIDNHNSQVFFDLSIRSLKHVHLYGSLFIDEFSLTRIKDKNRYNFYSCKAGIKVNNWPLKNIFYTVEYTQVSPITYKHRVETLTFESNRFNMGHYLGDNSREVFADIAYKPLRTMLFKLSYTSASKGVEHPYDVTQGAIPADTYPLLDTIVWQNQTISFSASWEFAYNCKLEIGIANSNIKAKNTDTQTLNYYLKKYTPEFFRGQTNTAWFGLHVGF